MAEMIDLARPRPEPAPEVKVADGPGEYYEKYSWQTRITLRDEELTKLGIDLSNYKGGDELDFTAKAKVIEIASSESEGVEKKHTDRRLELQVTHMALPNQSSFDDMFNEAAANEANYSGQPGGFR